MRARWWMIVATTIWLIGIEAAEGIERHSQIGGGYIVSEEVDGTALPSWHFSCCSRDFKSETSLMVLRSPNEAVIDAAGNNQSKNLAIGRGSVRFKGSPRCLSLATYPIERVVVVMKDGAAREAPLAAVLFDQPHLWRPGGRLRWLPSFEMSTSR